MNYMLNKQLLSMLLLLASAMCAYGEESVWTKDPSAWKVEIYPIYAWAPFMGANVSLPDFPNLPDQPGASRPSGNVSGSFNGAAFAGFRLEKSRWAVDTNVLWAGLSADHTNPNAHLKMDVIFGQIMGGREILPNLFLEGGARRLALNVGASIKDSQEVTRKPGFWDPLVGVNYVHPFRRKMRLNLTAAGGGFGVGADVDISVTGKLDWRFAKHFGTTLGYGMLYFKSVNTVRQQTLTVEPTLHGPIVGFGIYF
jgi:hypothetical protein